jgi:hypothetical protein
MSDYEDKSRARLEELRERQQQRAFELREKLNHANNLAQSRFNIQSDLKDRDLEFKREALERKQRFDSQKVVHQIDGSIELERLRHELRDLEREPDFMDYKMRSELNYLIGRQEGLDRNKIENLSLERRITEARHHESADIERLLIIALIEKLQSESNHEKTLSELDAECNHHLLKEMQSHDHTIKEDNNLSRLKIDEMIMQKILDAVFSQIGGNSSGLSRQDIQDIANEWEKEADKLKR